MGVFQIRNNITGKSFVGSSANLPGKFNSHKMQLETGNHMSKDLQNDWDEQGEDAFTFEVLEYLEPLDDPSRDYSDDLKFLESVWLDKLRPYGAQGYNREKRKP